MRIRFTSIVWEEVGEIVNTALVSLEGRVSGQLEKKDYGGGVESFLGVLVAVDKEDNGRFAKPHNRVGYVTGLGGERFKQISMAVEMLPSDLMGKDVAEISGLFMAALSRQLETPPIKPPNRFDWSDFTQSLRTTLTS